MTRADAFDLPVRAASDAALAAYRRGVEAMLTANAGAEAALGEALAQDPGFALAHAAMARNHQLNARIDAARAAIARASELVARGETRERQHVDVLALAFGGQGATALDALRTHMETYPRDAVVLSLALGVYGLIGFSGRVDHHAEQRRLLEELQPRWPADGWFLGYLGWAQAETGEPELGATTVERGLALKPRNANAAHGLTHAYVELGAAETGYAFLAPWIADYDRAGLLHCHLNWHLALYELDRGQSQAASRRFDEAIQPDRALAPPMPVLADAASFLWRCQLHAPGDGDLPWRGVAALVARAFPSSGLAFADLHAAMAEAATGDAASLARRIAALDQRAAAGSLPPGRVIPTLCRAVAAYAAGDDGETITLIEHALPDLPRIGGSHAQREVFEDTLVAACLRAGRHERARTLLQARLARRPREQDRRWLAMTTSMA
ncbi:MAG: tetratricopeptide repeat protein [Alphaproteobacteria bacterium]|nr:tetratricopeptide repeat protein [Alphaproteobacteria bacterium]